MLLVLTVVVAVTEGAFNAVVGKLRSDPVFLGGCILDLEGALKGGGV